MTLLEKINFKLFGDIFLREIPEYYFKPIWKGNKTFYCGFYFDTRYEYYGYLTGCLYVEHEESGQRVAVISPSENNRYLKIELGEDVLSFTTLEERAILIENIRKAYEKFYKVCEDHHEEVKKKVKKNDDFLKRQREQQKKRYLEELKQSLTPLTTKINENC